jgi:hypothetical protein
MVRKSSGTLPIRIQILVLAPFPGISMIYRRYELSGERRDDEASMVTSEISRSAVAKSSEVLVRVGFTFAAPVGFI